MFPYCQPRSYAKVQTRIKENRRTKTNFFNLERTLIRFRLYVGLVLLYSRMLWIIETNSFLDWHSKETQNSTKLHKMMNTQKVYVV